MDKYDSNYGIDSAWTKIVIHIYKDDAVGLYNLPRVLWVRKDWNLKQLHWAIFNHFRELFLRWYREISEKGSSDRNARQPQYYWKDKMLDLNSLEELFALNDLQQQFEVFFSGLNQDNWESALKTRYFDQFKTPYCLRLQNNAGYGSDCHHCKSSSCRTNCPCPYTEEKTVLDLLHQIGVEDNVSFFDKRGK